VDRAGARTVVPARRRGPSRSFNWSTAHSLGAIIDELATRFDAAVDVIAVDVAAMLKELADKRVLRL
jgi:hypothetical protein